MTRRAGIPAGEMCPGCGGVSNGVHLDRALVPVRAEVPARCLKHGAVLANTSFFRCGCRYVHPASPKGAQP